MVKTMELPGSQKFILIVQDGFDEPVLFRFVWVNE
jgi:hypothetical protein